MTQLYDFAKNSWIIMICDTPTKNTDLFQIISVIAV